MHFFVLYTVCTVLNVGQSHSETSKRTAQHCPAIITEQRHETPAVLVNVNVSAFKIAALVRGVSGKQGWKSMPTSYLMAEVLSPI